MAENEPPQPNGDGPAAGPRKPRIEVLQAGSARAPSSPDSTEEPTSFGLRHSRSTEGDGVRSSSGESEPPRFTTRRHDHEPDPGRRTSGLFNARTLMIALLALGALALLFGFISAERGQEADSEAAERAAVPADVERQYDTEFGTGDPNAVPPAGSLEDRLVAENAEPPPVAEGRVEGVAESADRQRSAETAAPVPPLLPAARPAPQTPPESRPVPLDERLAPPDGDFAPAEAEASALATVRDFYSALAQGDGASAARLVVPAKRRSGPLSARELTRYFSSFRRPLRVRRIDVLSDDAVEIAYSYVLADGRRCRGQALVNVVQANGRTLINRIRTRGPC